MQPIGEDGQAVFAPPDCWNPKTFLLACGIRSKLKKGKYSYISMCCAQDYPASARKCAMAQGCKTLPVQPPPIPASRYMAA